MRTPPGRFSSFVLVCGLGAASCAGAPPAPEPEPPARPVASRAAPAPILDDAPVAPAPVAAPPVTPPAPADPAPEMGMREVSERDW